MPLQQQLLVYLRATVDATLDTPDQMEESALLALLVNSKAQLDHPSVFLAQHLHPLQPLRQPQGVVAMQGTAVEASALLVV